MTEILEPNQTKPLSQSIGIGYMTEILPGKKKLFDKYADKNIMK